MSSAEVTYCVQVVSERCSCFPYANFRIIHNVVIRDGQRNHVEMRWGRESMARGTAASYALLARVKVGGAGQLKEILP